MKTVKDLLNIPGFTAVCRGNEDTPVTGGYIGDLLSVVMGNMEQGQVWLTVQSHMNIVAVASLREAAAIVITHDFEPEEDTVEAAREEGITLLKTSLNPFEAAKLLMKELCL